MTVYRIRPAVALATTVPAPILVLVASLLLVTTGRPFLVVAAAVYVVLAVMLASRMYRRVRRRTLTVSDVGLALQRDAHLLQVPWSGVVAVERRRRQLFIVADELVLANPVVSFVDANGKPTRSDKAVGVHPAGTRVQVSLYDKDWRNGPIGARLGEMQTTTA